MPRSRIALEIGTHSPWISRLLSELGHEVIVANARKVRLIGESRKKDDRLDAQTLGAAGPDRSAVAVSGEASQRAGASGSDDDSSARRPGASPHGAGEHGTRAGEVLRRTIARLHLRLADYPFSFIGQWLSDGKQPPLEILFLGVIYCYVSGSP